MASYLYDSSYFFSKVSQSIYLLCLLTMLPACGGGSSSVSVESDAGISSSDSGEINISASSTGSVEADDSITSADSTVSSTSDTIAQADVSSEVAYNGLDKDHDGYTASDCDDTNRFIYPGISVSCSADSGDGYKTCLSSGQFSGCNAGPICEATASGKCYYVSTTAGKDCNNGSYSAPFKSFKNLNWKTTSKGQFAEWQGLQPGDVVYLGSGQYSPEEGPIDLSYTKGTADAPIVVKAYPGAKPVISPQSMSDDVPLHGITIYQGAYITISGIEIRNTRNQGIFVEESDNITISNCQINGTWGESSNNLAGIYIVRSTNVRIHHNSIFDNYDRNRGWACGNGTILFQGGNNRVDHNLYSFSDNISSDFEPNAILYKHAADVAGQVFEADHNIITNYKGLSIGTGSGNSIIHHNLIIRSAPLKSLDFGGSTINQNIYFENNTIIDGAGIDYTPSSDYASVGKLYFRNNIVFDNYSYASERGIVRICEYCDSSLYQQLAGNDLLEFSANCYYNPNYDLSFRFFAGNPPPDGAAYSFPDWQALGYDRNSFYINPQLDASYNPTTPQCTNKGWLSE